MALQSHVVIVGTLLHAESVQNECMVQDHADIIRCSCSNVESG